uniref:Uncharacterized protein n=1 Tax=Physcomitrium patens TaxID=3218 RepID=A0A2K1IWV1_PHYPA|nr:hypothetical protein PHYPA_023570 [Physcomitrium patens]
MPGLFCDSCAQNLQNIFRIRCLLSAKLFVKARLSLSVCTTAELCCQVRGPQYGGTPSRHPLVPFLRKWTFSCNEDEQ